MDFDEIGSFFESHDNYYILTHKSPDGDTLGCGFALCGYLRSNGKKANVLNSDGFPKRYDFLYSDYSVQQFEPECVVAVDIADTQLLGSELAEYAQEGKIDLCIDHHISNKYYAKNTYVDSSASAACLVLYEFFKHIGAEISDQVAKCLYTGIATDTGCFKFENTTPKAHIAAAELMQYDIDHAAINRAMFDIKSRARLAVEQAVMSNIEFHLDGRCAMICITSELMASCGADDSEFDGLASLPLQVEGVQIGITVKQRDAERFKLSVRTTEPVDASEFCKHFNGGGHIRAAGCEIKGSLDDVKAKILEYAAQVLGVE